MDCDRWKANHNVNPQTGRKIKIRGPTYKKIEKECGPSGVKVRRRRIKIKKIENVLAPLPRRRPRVIQIHDIWVDDRIDTANEIARDLESIDVQQWQICISGNKKTFKNYLKNIKILGQGSFGQVYLAKLNNNTIVVKEAVLRLKEKSAMQRAISRTQRSWKFPENVWPEEYIMLTWVKQLVMTKKCPNFLLGYHMAACEGCVVETLGGKQKGDCYVTFMEPASYDMAKLENIKDKETQESLLYQLLVAVYAIEKYYQIQHNDIKLENILIKETPQLKGQYFDYVINGTHYYVENTGYTLFLSDFGVSRAFSPVYSFQGYYGERNAEIKLDAKGIPYFDPLTSTKFITPGRTKKYVFRDPIKFKWKDGVNGTHNRFFKHKDIGISRPVDLNNVEKFPPFEFFYDVQDVIRTFTGGKRMSQPGSHRGLTYLNPKLKAKLEQKLTPREVYFNMYWSIYDVEYFLASRMLEHLYTPIPTPVNLIGTYNMV